MATFFSLSRSSQAGSKYPTRVKKNGSKRQKNKQTKQKTPQQNQKPNQTKTKKGTKGSEKLVTHSGKVFQLFLRVEAVVLNLQCHVYKYTTLILVCKRLKFKAFHRSLSPSNLVYTELMTYT